MPRIRDLPLALQASVPLATIAARRAEFPARRPPRSPSPVALLGLLAIVATAAGAQERGASETPLHVAASRFEFVASGDTQPPSKPLAVHNGGAAPLTGVRLMRLTYADSSRASGWLFALPRQSSVSPNELATIGALCVDATGLAAGIYHATAAVAAREVAEPVGITITLVVKDAAPRRPPRDSAHGGRDRTGDRARPAPVWCGDTATKSSKGS